MKLRQRFSEYKERAIALRREGNSYADIRAVLGVAIPRGTLSDWLSELELSDEERGKLAERLKKKLLIARAKSVISRRKIGILRDDEIRSRSSYLIDVAKNDDVAKISLAMIYWCEGGKSCRNLTLGNSDPALIRTYLLLLRKCYRLDEAKFRGTVQCRADQDIAALERYWSAVSSIPPRQLYKSRIDPRTIGKPTRKIDYKGVFKVDYFSTEIYNELEVIRNLFGQGL
ncbi:MAG TPA: hypothetical protein VMT99_03820 [Candidatus Paceibacterota bacterium]|nr:hypothetical protein [Candidatus Paceibacterota bacterium]